MGDERGCSRRERLEVILTALLPAALGLSGALAAEGGRLCWLGPVLALPLGLWLCRLWEALGERDLPRGLTGAFGPVLGRVARLVYLLWGLLLLTESARSYSDRLHGILRGQGSEWLFLAAALGLCLWLGRGRGGAFARTGRIFFLTTAITLILALGLSLPSLDWRNLWPPEGADWAGSPRCGLLSLSLSGYGVYALCLPRRRGGELKGWPWALWGCGGLCALTLAVVGAFGPRLTAEMGEPFLLLLQGVEVPGAFRRGEAALAALLSLADLVLLALLTRGCGELWESLAPKGWGWAGALPVGGAFLAAGLLPGGLSLGRWVIPGGNLLLGMGVPLLAILTTGGRKEGKGQSTFSGKNFVQKEDVGGKTGHKKSKRENEKKC